MDNTVGTVNEGEFGKLVLHAIPTKETEELVISYLSRIVKNVPAEKLARKIKITPCVLSKNIAVKNGEKIARNLRALGAKVEFVPHDPDAQGFDRPHQATLAPEFESIHQIPEQNKSQPAKPPGSSSFGKRLITAMVVIIMIAVFSVLSWQLYQLVTEKYFAA